MNAKKLFKPKSLVRQASRLSSKKSIGLLEPQGCIYTIKDGAGDGGIRGQLRGDHGKCCLEVNRLRTELDSLKKENDLYRERFQMERNNHKQLRDFYQHRELEWNEIIEHHKRIEKDYAMSARNLQSGNQILHHGSGMQTGLHNGLSNRLDKRINNRFSNVLNYGLNNGISNGLNNEFKSGFNNEFSIGFNSGKQSRVRLGQQNKRNGIDRGHSASQFCVMVSSPLQKSESRVRSRQWKDKMNIETAARPREQWRLKPSRLQTAKSTSTLNSRDYQAIRESTQPPSMREYAQSPLTEEHESVSPLFTSVVMSICSEMKLNNLSLKDIQHYTEMRELYSSIRNKSKDQLIGALKRLYGGEMRDQQWQGLWAYIIGEVGSTSGLSIYNYLFLQISKMFRNMDSKQDILNESHNPTEFKQMLPIDDRYESNFNMHRNLNADSHMNSLGNSGKMKLGNGDSITVLSRGEGDSVATSAQRRTDMVNDHILTNQSSEMTLSIVGSIEMEDSYEVYPVSRSKDPISMIGNLINAQTGWGLRKDTGPKKDIGLKSKGYAETVRRIQRINTVESFFQDDEEEEEIKMDISEVRDVGSILRQNRQNNCESNSQNIFPD